MKRHIGLIAICLGLFAYLALAYLLDWPLP